MWTGAGDVGEGVWDGGEWVVGGAYNASADATNSTMEFGNDAIGKQLKLTQFILIRW